jgi:hypothetical protein
MIIPPCPCLNPASPFLGNSTEATDLPAYRASGFCKNGDQEVAYSFTSEQAAEATVEQLLAQNCPSPAPGQYCANAVDQFGNIIAQICNPVSQDFATGLANSIAAIATQPGAVGGIAPNPAGSGTGGGGGGGGSGSGSGSSLIIYPPGGGAAVSFPGAIPGIGTMGNPLPTGTVTVTITPSNGTWTLDNGLPQPSGGTLSNVSSGNHTIYFPSLPGLVAPARQTITVKPGSSVFYLKACHLLPILSQKLPTVFSSLYAYLTFEHPGDLGKGSWTDEVTGNPYTFEQFDGNSLPASLLTTGIPVNPPAVIQSGQTSSCQNQTRGFGFGVAPHGVFQANLLNPAAAPLGTPFINPGISGFCWFHWEVKDPTMPYLASPFEVTLTSQGLPVNFNQILATLYVTTSAVTLLVFPPHSHTPISVTINITIPAYSWVFLGFTIDLVNQIATLYVGNSTASASLATVWNPAIAGPLWYPNLYPQILSNQVFDGVTNWQPQSTTVIDEAALVTNYVMTSADMQTAYNSGHGLAYY